MNSSIGRIGKMSKDQEDHLQSIKDSMVQLINEKYRKGAVEHGGNLWDMSGLQLLQEAMNETADQTVYLLTLRAHIVELEKKVAVLERLVKKLKQELGEV